jgi:hypothetical protein
MSNILSAREFVNYITNTTDLDDKTKIVIQSKLCEIENLIIKNKNDQSFNNWSSYINSDVLKYVIYYHNYDRLVPRFLNKIWDNLTDERKEKWVNKEYTDNYPYVLLLFDYSASECDIIYQSYKSYMQDKNFYLGFGLIISKLIILLSLNNEYLLSYLVENIIINIQRIIIKMCKSSKILREKMIKIFQTYKENVNENNKLYFINTLKKLMYYDKFDETIKSNVKFNDKNQIKYI